jgi:hypothetical protein
LFEVFGRHPGCAENAKAARFGGCGNDIPAVAESEDRRSDTEQFCGGRFH